MGIEYFRKKISSEQLVIPAERQLPVVSGLEDGESTFIGDTSVWMDRDGKFWVDNLAISIKDLNLRSENDYIRIMKLPEGIIVDISQVRDNFLDEDGMLFFKARDLPESATEGYAYEKVPVIDLITTEEAVEAFREILQTNYSYEYPIIVPSSDS
jgi:hypothetical protein